VNAFITKEQKENARARRIIMTKHEEIPEFFYNMIWIFLVSSITKCDYKINGSNLGIKKRFPNYFS
jgi:hypothetical protein